MMELDRSRPVFKKTREGIATECSYPLQFSSDSDASFLCEGFVRTLDVAAFARASGHKSSAYSKWLRFQLPHGFLSILSIQSSNEEKVSSKINWKLSVEPLSVPVRLFSSALTEFTRLLERLSSTVRQYTVICLPNASHYKCNVAEINSEEGFPIWPSQTGWCKVYRLCPLLEDNRDKSGLALDGDLKNEDTTLASSTIVPPNSSREALGIVVQYKVKIRLILGFGLSDVCLELPFILTHPNPEPDVAATGGEGVCLTDNPLDDLQFSEGGRPDDESSGGEGGGITTSSPLTLQPTSNGGSSTVAAAASKPQMGLLAKRAAAVAATNGVSVGSGERKSPPHIAEFLRASEMPDGMPAFASPSLKPSPQSQSQCGIGMVTSTEAVDALDGFLWGVKEPQRPVSSNGNPSDRCPQSSLSASTSASPALSPSNTAKNCCTQQLPSTSDALVPVSVTPAVTVASVLSQLASTAKPPVMDTDDLIFEDFARLRLMEQQQKQQQQHQHQQQQQVQQQQTATH
ncbi:hypothetical protein Aperf_G00000092672 [Anoplocephala perfoliata]